MPDDFEVGGEDFDNVSSNDTSGDLAATWNGLAADRPQPEPTPDIEPPQSWPADRKARWSSLSPEDREFIAAREAEAHSRISQQGQELARLRAEYERARSSSGQLEQYQQEIATLQGKYERQLAEINQRDQPDAFDKFAADKPYCKEDGFLRELTNEMRALVAEVPGLYGTMLLKLAHDRLAERVGIPQLYEQQRLQQQQQHLQQQQQREQEIHRHISERDAQWQAELARREAEWARQATEMAAQRERYAAEHARMARRAAKVNVKGTPGHSTNPKTVDDTLREVANRLYSRD